MIHILGVGVGLFLLIAIGTTAIFLSIVSLRTHKNLELYLILKVVVVTVVLFSIPRESETPTQPVFKIYDHLFVWRTIVLILLGISSLAGFVLYLFGHLMKPRHAQPLKQWKL